jgi:hypothetical protein
MTALWLNLAATLYLTGLIWTIQVVHYPLMNRVAPERFVEFHRQHGARISLVVIAPMVIELATAALLAIDPPPGVPAAATLTGLALVAVIWISTFAIQVPCHNRLGRGFDGATHRRLVLTNWLRTVTWTVRAVLMMAAAILAGA